MSDAQLLAFIGLCALATFATRVVPFLFLSRHADHPLILHLGRYLPPAVMMILVVYALRDLSVFDAGHFNGSDNGLPLVIASLTVVVLHLWRRHALISIMGGTLVYMAIVQIGATG